ncbi:MAG: anti-sigma factor [Phycisphaerales bacterium]|nr:anti-sigma factor [Phycisphaerales bacterium]
MTRHNPNPSNNRNAHGKGAGGRAVGAELAQLRARMDELLMARATFGLEASEEAELELIADRLGTGIDEGFDRAAAAADLALSYPGALPMTSGAGAGGNAMPEALKARIMAAGNLWAAQQRSPHQPGDLDQIDQPAQLTLVGLDEADRRADLARRSNTRWTTVRSWSGWVAAAACLAFAVVSRTGTNTGGMNSGAGVLGNSQSGGGSTASVGAAGKSLIDIVRGTSTPQDAISALIAASLPGRDDVVSVPILAATVANPDRAQVARPLGDVIWSASAQKGVLLLTDLPAVQTAGMTYQLWVVDAMRDERYPVSAGVFAVASDKDVNVIEFKPSVRVDYATRFLITIEQAGGVMVSTNQDVTGFAPAESVQSPVLPTTTPTPMPIELPKDGNGGGKTEGVNETSRESMRVINSTTSN